MHDKSVSIAIQSASSALLDAESIAKQAPEELGRIKLTSVVEAFGFAKLALTSEPRDLRGELSAAHSMLRRCRFPRQEHNNLFSSIADVVFALEEIEQAASAADYPPPLHDIALPRQHLVPRGLINAELGALKEKLEEVDLRLTELSAERTSRADLQEQVALIDFVTKHAGSKTEMAHALSRGDQVDVRGLSVVIGSLGRIIDEFGSTVAARSAKVVERVKTGAIRLVSAGKGLARAGANMITRVMAVSNSLTSHERPAVDQSHEEGALAFWIGNDESGKKLVHFVPGSGKEKYFKDHALTPDMVVVPAGEFIMGSGSDGGANPSNESPLHLVNIAKPFAVGRFAVTVAEFKAFVSKTGYVIGHGCLSHKTASANVGFDAPGFPQSEMSPVTCVSWGDAQAYVSWLRDFTARPYRLLSEAEWEYVARAGTTTRYWFGDTLGSHTANFGGADYTSAGTVRVDAFFANPWGLYNVHGNVWEWVEDVWVGSYHRAPTDGSARIDSENSARQVHVLRGGGWTTGGTLLRSAARSFPLHGEAEDNIGFRVARDLES